MKCPVCGNNTFTDTDYEHEICEECFWEYDLIQVENPDYAGGANRHSLIEYKALYQGLKEKNPGFSCTNDSDRNLMVDLTSKR